MRPIEAGPVLRTARLELRPFAHIDIDELHALFTDVDVRRYLLDGEAMPREWVEGEVAASNERFESNGTGLWALRLRGATPIVGFAGFRPFFDPPELQLLYGILRAHWGRGLATEAAAELVRHAFEVLGHEEVRAATDVPNAASMAVLERLGFVESKRTDDGEWGTAFFRLRRLS